MRRDVMVYLSGPMAQYNGGLTIEQNLAAAIAIHHELLQAGVPNICPHLSGLVPSAWTVLTPEQWLAYDEAVIDRCTHVLMLAGWAYSRGARHEYRYAVGKRLPIALNLSELMGMVDVLHEVR